MKQMTFSTVGMLPKSEGRWHVREGGGHLWFVPEDVNAKPYVLYNGLLTPVVDAGEDPTAPLIMPKVDA